VKFIVDAQLPRRVSHMLRSAGHDSVHTLDLPDGNLTNDAAIIDIAAREGRTVVTKDYDFVRSYLVNNQPEKLLLVSTGNIRNTELEGLLLRNLPLIIDAFGTGRFVELNRTVVIVHS